MATTTTLVQPPALAEPIELHGLNSAGEPSSGGRPLGPLPSKHDAAVDDTKDQQVSIESGSPPPDAHGEVERWNYPRGNVPRLGFVFLCFIIAGMNDGAVGVCFPLLLLRNVIEADNTCSRR